MTLMQELHNRQELFDVMSRTTYLATCHVLDLGQVVLDLGQVLEQELLDLK